MKSVTITRIVAFSIFSALCSYQCYLIIYNYLKDPRIIDIHEVSPNIARTFPGVTLCNNNRVSLRKVFDLRPEIKNAIMKEYPNLFEDRYNFVNPKNFEKFRDFVSETYKRFNYSANEELSRTLMNERYNLMPPINSFIKTVTCAVSTDGQLRCNKVNKIESIQDRVCVTLAHQGALTYYNTHHRISPHKICKNTKGIDHFNSREVIRILIDFQPEDYGDLKRQIGARLTLNANSYVASAADKDFYIERGYKYEFNLDRQDTILFENCYEYEDINIEPFKDFINPRLPLHSETCVQNCISENVVLHSKCWPPTMPYYRNDSLDQFKNIKQCEWFREAQYFVIYRDLLLNDSKGSKKNEKVAQLFRRDMRIYANITRYCRSRCKLSCKLTQFSITKSRSLLPSKIVQALDRTGNERITNYCCAMISIKYTKFYYSVFEFVPKYNIADTVGNLGGLLAVWLGISIVSIYHALMKLIEIFNRRRSQRRIASEREFWRSSTAIHEIVKSKSTRELLTERRRLRGIGKN